MEDIVEVLPCGVCDARTGRKHHSRPLWVHHCSSWLWPEDWAFLACREDFPISCPAFRCSLICRLYFYLPSLPAPSSLPSLGSLWWSTEGLPSLAIQQLQLESALLMIGLSVHLWSLRLSSYLPFLRLAADDASLPTCFSPSRLPPSSPAELVELHRE